MEKFVKSNVPELRLEDLKLSNVRKLRPDDSLELSLINEETSSIKGQSVKEETPAQSKRDF